MTSYYEGNNTIDSSMNIFGFLRYIAFPIVPILFLSYFAKAGIELEKKDLLISLTLLYVIVHCVRHTAMWSLGRYNDYLTFPMAIVFSFGLSKTLYSRTKATITSIFKNNVLILFLFVLFSINTLLRSVHSEIFPMYYPYSSVITKNIDEDRETLYRQHGIW